MSVRRLSTSIPVVAILLALPLVACSGKDKKTVPVPPAQEVTRPVQAIAPAPTPPPPAPKPVETDIWQADLETLNEYLRREGLLGDVYFAYDQAMLSDEARERLARNAKLLAQRPELVVSIEGHCDERGTAEYNVALGDRRSHAALTYVQSSGGVSTSRLRSISYGKERPVCNGSDESCWSRNRRASFVVIGRL